MKLSDFIRRNAESIAKEWEDFARTCHPAAATMTIAALRDHILPLLKLVADDMEAPQTSSEQSAKAQGRQTPAGSADSDAETHAAMRVIDGFTVDQVVGEFRALRASILRLWLTNQPPADQAEMSQVVRFNEAIDQMLAESVVRHGVLELARSEASNRRDAFLAVLSHELRNPLSAISSASQIVAMTEGTNPIIGRASEVMVRQTRHLGRLLDDLLDLSRISRDRISLHPTATDIRECVDDAVDVNREAITQKQHELLLHKPETPLVGEIDCTRIVQLVSNLLNNAAKYSPPASTIHVSLTRDDDNAIISVEDNGPGIDPSMLQDIFGVFFPGQQRELGKTGLGIGLWLAKRLAELHGGTIVARSEGPGRGAEFRVTIPLRQTAPQTNRV